MPNLRLLLAALLLACDTSGPGDTGAAVDASGEPDASTIDAPRDAPPFDAPRVLGRCADTAIGRAAAALSPGDFVELETGITRELLYVDTGTHDILGYAIKGAWDEGTCQALFLGAGHLETTRFLAYSADTNTWAAAPSPDWWCPNDQPNPYACFRHAYGLNTIDPETGRLFYVDFTGQVESLLVTSPLGTDWVPTAALPERSATNSTYTSLEYFPARHSLIFFDYYEGNVLELADGAPSWTVADTFTAGPYHLYVAGNLVGRTVMYGGGNDSYAFRLMEADGTHRDVAPPPQTFHPAPESSATFGALIGDPESPRYLAFGPDGTFSAYDPATDSWTPPEARLGGHYGVPFPIPDLGVTMILTAEPRVLLFRAP